MELTQEEKKIIRKLHILAKIWPETLWLFAGNGPLYVMKVGDDGNQVIDKSGGVDSTYSVAAVDIPNGGGGW